MTLYLIGGGSPELQSPITQMAFKDATRALYWPFASSETDILGAEDWFVSSLRQQGITVPVEAWLTTDGHEPGELEQFDLLYLGGGSPTRLGTQLATDAWIEAVRHWVREGGTYVGDSAGALEVCEWLTIAASLEDEPKSVGMPGLGLIEGFSLLPHSDTFPAGSAQQFSSTHDIPVIEVPENTAAVIPGDCSHPSIETGTIRSLGVGVASIVAPDGTKTAVPPLAV